MESNLRRIPLKRLAAMVKDGEVSITDFYAQCAARGVATEAGERMLIREQELRDREASVLIKPDGKAMIVEGWTV